MPGRIRSTPKQVYPIPGKIGGKIPYFKDAATPADVADGSVTGYAATFDRQTLAAE